MRLATVLVVLAAAIVGEAERPGTQTLTLNEVLFRANEFVVAYQKQFSSVVAEERYTQTIVSHTGETKRTRTLVSDFLLVQQPTEDSWIGFRDVFEVDGKPVRDRQERLQKLFLESPPGALNQAEKIARESARYNIGEVLRNINIPTLPLLFLHPLNQYRFYFEKIGEEAIEGTETWAVRYTEQQRPTVIRSGRNDLFARGTLWIDPSTGRVIRSQLIVGDANTPVRSEITVLYRPNATLGVWVPAEMEEIYDAPKLPREDRIRGVAMYSNFRRFAVKVDEKIGVPK